MTSSPLTGDATPALPKGNRSGRFLPLGLILLLATLVYLPTLGAYYCGYDDYNEALRARDDLARPAAMFTTSHFGTSKYRPLNRALTAAGFYLGNGNPVIYRIRNLAFHLVVVAAIYGLALMLIESRAAAFAGALLFALHPLANQSVVGATWTNTAAYAMMFTSFLLFASSVERPSGRTAKLWLALLLGAAALFTYEATLVLFILMALYIAIRSFFGKYPMPGPSWMLAACAGTLLIFVIFFGARSLFAAGQTALSPPRTIFVNLAVYVTALLIPVDVLLANSLFDFPLPSELLSDSGLIALVFMIGIGAVSVVLFVIVNLLISRARSGRTESGIDWRILFFFAAICASLLPFLAFTEHASETYLYPCAAFLCLMLALGAEKFLPAKGFPAAVAILAVLFGSATFARNERVLSCGSTARKVLTSLPLDSLRQGSWNLVLSPFPDEPIPVRYGIYSYAGLGTIDPGNAMSVNSALQLVTGNRQVTASAVFPAEMPAMCADSANKCFWVHSDGAVEPYKQNSGKIK
jgi:hypothetical protein